MNKERGKKFCKDCGTLSIYHVQNWLDEFTNRLFPPISLPRKFGFLFDALLDKIFTIFRLASWKNDFRRSDIQLRSTCFIEEARKRGVEFKALRGPFGYTNHFRAEINGKPFRFESLPIADFASKLSIQIVGDKERTKKHLKKGGFPIADGKSFWFWQKKKAIQFGIGRLGFPLVAKPRGGSVSRHVTTNIQDSEKLKKAIDNAITYSPAFIIERFIANAFVYRATVIDFDFVACVKQVPANVVGDSISTIRVLIDKKNGDSNRGGPHQKEFTLHRIVENETTEKLLSERGYTFYSVPKKDEIVFLQYDPFLKLGGDLIEMTPQVHPDNLKLFHQVARFFDIKVVGIDFLASDISRSWKTQQSAILELNSLPCIELHHFPSSGRPQNVAKPITDLFFKYYL
ncbi:MAG: hypothetical protein Q8N16_04180 [bacterium]|nr:hypothetical protein [bacterium]